MTVKEARAVRKKSDPGIAAKSRDSGVRIFGFGSCLPHLLAL